MSSSLLMDNWLLVEVSTCLMGGLSAEELYKPFWVQNKHQWLSVPTAIDQLDALFSLLMGLVLREVIIVDEKYSNSWRELFAINYLEEKGVLRVESASFDEEQLEEYNKRKEAYLTELFRRPKFIDDALIAGLILESSKVTADSPIARYASQVIFGVTHYLSLSEHFNLPYIGHPDRKRLLEKTIFPYKHFDAVAGVTNFIDKERVRVYRQVLPSFENRVVTAILPPIIVEIIENSSSLDDLIPVAMQVRSKYKKLREWLMEYQNAFQDEDPEGLAKHKRVLNAVSSDLNSLLGESTQGETFMSLSFGWVSLPLPIRGINRITQRLGIRAMLNNLILSKQGKSSLRKLLSIFGEEGSLLGKRVQSHFEEYGLRKF